MSNTFTQLDPHLLRSYNLHLQRCKNWRDLQYLTEWLKAPHIWKEPMVSVDTFLDDPHYLGIGDFVYPKVREYAKGIIEGDFQQAAIVAGIGAGKTTLSELLATYQAHRLLCLRNPHNYFGLAADKSISIINMGTTATQALDNAFAGIKKFIKNSPFFIRYNPRIINTRIQFTNPDILIISGNSKSRTVLGYNVFCAILDEAAFFLDNEDKNIAEEIYTALQRRIVSRFGSDGLLIMISSPNYEGDFIMKKLDEARAHPDVIYAAQLPTWKGKPIARADMKNKFYFNWRKGTIYKKPPKSFGKVSKVEDEFDMTKEIWEIPGEYKPSFIQDPDKAKRDFAAVPSKSIAAFMPNTSLIDKMFNKLPSPVQANGKYEFPEPALRTSYYIHVDLALNKKGKGDYAGLAMVHFDGWHENEKTGEKQKRIIVDLAEKISAGPTGEIEFSDVRNKIYSLKAMGYNIKLVTLDSYQSVDTMQKLRKKGIKSDYLSVDRTVEPYQTLKELIYTEFIECHAMPDLREELARLEITKTSKIDHPPGASKDISDAVCGAVYSCITSTGGQIGMASGPYYAARDAKGHVKEGQIKHAKSPELLAKEAHYRKLQSYVDRGIL